MLYKWILVLLHNQQNASVEQQKTCMGYVTFLPPISQGLRLPLQNLSRVMGRIKKSEAQIKRIFYTTIIRMPFSRLQNLFDELIQPTYHFWQLQSHVTNPNTTGNLKRLFGGTRDMPRELLLTFRRGSLDVFQEKRQNLYRTVLRN